MTKEKNHRPNIAVIHYRRPAEDYDGWGLHLWGPVEEQVNWHNPLPPARRDDFGLVWEIRLTSGARRFHFIIHRGNEKDPGPDQTLDLERTGSQVWVVQGSDAQFTDPDSALNALAIYQIGEIRHKARAHWLARDTIAWPVDLPPQAHYALHFDPEGHIEITPEGLRGGKALPLTYVSEHLDPILAARHPHLHGCVELKIPDEHLHLVPEILRGQMVVLGKDPTDGRTHATALQLPGVLDDLYPYEGPLGVTFHGATPTLRLWAPTARSVSLLLYPDPLSRQPVRTLPMEFDPHRGVWWLSGEPGWKGLYYLYEVEVFVRQEGKVVRNQVTDPYALSLSTSSRRSQIVDLEDPALMPDGWHALRKPSLTQTTDIVIYELHVRDFSAWDPHVPAEHRGGYLAFTHPNSAGMRHLRRLAKAGVTHIQLLPAFDFASVNEDRSTWRQPDFKRLATYPPDSDKQQEEVVRYQHQDGYNWGYDPHHYFSPEGSYATDPDGPARILEFRRMVQSLSKAGLRVIMDVAFNHTYQSGQDEFSVLDKIVPGYYYRLDEDGQEVTSTCCHDTASEHAMMAKLMEDAVLTWAKAYQVDGFRFDLMGHHMRHNLTRIRAALDSLTLAHDGVDGKAIYLLGEGWDFGPTAHNARGVNASQINMAGTGIGTFNDRIRDAVRGGGPFTGLRDQGLVTGLFTTPNESELRSAVMQRAQLHACSDLIRISLAGGLADYRFTLASGETKAGKEWGFNGGSAGYTASPVENVVYVSAHDNETLFDAVQLKASFDLPLSERVRMHNLAISLVALSQGIPFFHAGVELLRSKSLDRDSYNSGDWFNRLDFTASHNNWGVGLPPWEKNGRHWGLMGRLLGQPELRPPPDQIHNTLSHFEEMLQIRRSTPLFRLASAREVITSLRFHNTGPDQIPGVIAMSLTAPPEHHLATPFRQVFVVFNASPTTQRIPAPDSHGETWSLHPIQQQSADPLVRQTTWKPERNQFGVPGRTTAVFVSQYPPKGSQKQKPTFIVS